MRNDIYFEIISCDWLLFAYWPAVDIGCVCYILGSSVMKYLHKNYDQPIVCIFLVFQVSLLSAFGVICSSNLDLDINENGLILYNRQK